MQRKQFAMQKDTDGNFQHQKEIFQGKPAGNLMADQNEILHI